MILASILSDAIYLYGSALAITVMASSAGWLWRHTRDLPDPPDED